MSPKKSKKHKEHHKEHKDHKDRESIRASGGGLKAFVSGFFKKKEDKHSPPSPPS